ncbi:DUF389 domain-containing protein [Phycicoccus sp. M110.8]|uniref:DUF389 domain-containing protein n=1 Tax=Phycicoccus sp. M110.8 TaxID=3075433 RepID=UPI0028FD4DB5|nr:DUF389 domain-containing protein [Phycicoccus sp. M110.8]MDU0313269.1 DUF389 domain-containing protein [Phycicoccus sp. M110.8]
MLQLRISVRTELADDVLQVLTEDPAVSSVAAVRGASIKPSGDLLFADVAREAANDVIDRLRTLGVQDDGTIHVEPVTSWLSRPGLEAERLAPGSGADSVVWLQVTQRAIEDSETNWTFMSFMVLATLIAGVAIVLDSPVLVVGAMILGPEFGPIAALGLALVRRRYGLLRRAVRALVLGFATAIAVTFLAGLAAGALGWVTGDDLTGSRPATAFIYRPDQWSFFVAVVAAAAGVLSMTSSRVGGLTGVFVSVTTIPAAGNIGLGLAFGAWHEVRGSALQLVVNLTGMALAGWVALALQQVVWSRVSRRRARLARRLRPAAPID